MIRKPLFKLKKEGDKDGLTNREKLIKTIAIIVAFICVFAFFFKILFF